MQVMTASFADRYDPISGIFHRFGDRRNRSDPVASGGQHDRAVILYLQRNTERPDDVRQFVVYIQQYKLSARLALFQHDQGNRSFFSVPAAQGIGHTLGFFIHH